MFRLQLISHRSFLTPTNSIHALSIQTAAVIANTWIGEGGEGWKSDSNPCSGSSRAWTNQDLPLLNETLGWEAIVWSKVTHALSRSGLKMSIMELLLRWHFPTKIFSCNDCLKKTHKTTNQEKITCCTGLWKIPTSLTSSWMSYW